MEPTRCKRRRQRRCSAARFPPFLSFLFLGFYRALVSVAGFAQAAPSSLGFSAGALDVPVFSEK